MNSSTYEVNFFFCLINNLINNQLLFEKVELEILDTFLEQAKPKI